MTSTKPGRVQGTRSPTYIRHRMLDMGWNPLRLLTTEKRPIDRGWPKLQITHELIDEWAEHPRARKPRFANTGIRCDGLLGIDLDTNHEHVTAWVSDIVRDWLGDTPFVRVGNPVRCLMLYRVKQLLADVPHEHIRATSQWNEPDEGLSHRVEVKQGAGGQIVAYGMHSSGNEYCWPGAANPLDNRWADLPAVPVSDVVKLIEEIEGVFEDEAGFVRARGTAGPADHVWRYDLEPDMEFDTNQGMFTAIELERFLKRIPAKARNRLRIEVFMDPIRETDHNRMTGVAGLASGSLFIHDFSEDTNHTWSRAIVQTKTEYNVYADLAAKLKEWGA